MNRRGRLSIAAGVLVLMTVAYFGWGYFFGFPPSRITYYSPSTGGISRVECFLGIPYSWENGASIVTEAKGMDETDVRRAGDWKAFSYRYPNDPFMPPRFRAVFSLSSAPASHFMEINDRARDLPPRDRQRIVRELQEVLRDPALRGLAKLTYQVRKRHPLGFAGVVGSQPIPEDLRSR